MAVMRDKSGHTSKPLIKGEKAQSSEKKGLDSISPNQYLVVFPRCFPPSSSAFSGALFSDNVSRIETALKQPINAVTRLSFSQPPPRCRGTKQGKRNSPFFLSGSLVPNWARVKSTSRGKVKEDIRTHIYKYIRYKMLPRQFRQILGNCCYVLERRLKSRLESTNSSAILYDDSQTCFFLPVFFYPQRSYMLFSRGPISRTGKTPESRVSLKNQKKKRSERAERMTKRAKR